MPRLGNVGNAVYYTEPVEANPVNNLESLRELCTDIEAGKVNTLLILSSNPVYDAPHDFEFHIQVAQSPPYRASELGISTRRPSIACGTSRNRITSRLGVMHAPSNGTVSVIQPLIAPLYRTHSAHEVSPHSATNLV